MEDPAAAAAAAGAAMDAANAVLAEEKAAEVVATVTEASAAVVDATTAAAASASDAVVSALGGAEAVTAAGEAVGAAVASLDAASAAAAATVAGAAVADEGAVAAAGAVAGTAVAATAASAVLVKNVATLSLAKDMWATYSGLLSVYPLATKSVTGSFLYSLSDGIAQKAAAAKASADEEDDGGREGAASTDDASDEDSSEIDRGRVARFAAWGPIDAFMTTVWYGVLDSWTETAFPTDAAAVAADADAVAGLATGATNWSKVAFEVAADQVVYCPIWFLAFFSFTGIWERRPAVETATRIKTEIVPAVTTSWWIWVPVMTVSFGFVPSELRVPYYLVASFAYAMLLSALWGDAGAGKDRSEEDA